MINSEEYETKNKELRKRLKKLNQEQSATAERSQNWYEIVGSTLGMLENVNNEFRNGDVLVKKHILMAIGSNPILTGGKISIKHFEWLRPLKDNKQTLTDKLNKVRTDSQQIEKDSEESIIQSWYTGRESNPRHGG